MNGRLCHSIRAAVIGFSLIGFALQASAFFTYGGFDVTEEKVLVRWPRDAMDTNQDGVISGENEGVEILIEGGEFGFTANEVNVVMDAFNVWEDVATSYMAFALYGPILEPLFVGVIDQVNFVAMQFPDDPIHPPLGDSYIGLAMFTFTIDEETYMHPSMPSLLVPVPAGTMIECDILINGEWVRSSGGLAGLMGVMVHEIGHLVAIGHNLISNDDPVMFRDPSGVRWDVGLKPTMYPYFFWAQDTLAPDDIAALSFLYPRGSEEMLFGFNSEARTHTQQTLPSAPILGGAITAWCDVDNNPTTPRVPFTNTMTGLYESAIQTTFGGMFEKLGLFKTLETPAGQPFSPTYTFTIGPLEDPAYLDSMHRFGDDQRSAYDVNFPAEVFREDATTVFGLYNHDEGTPLVFSQSRRKVVSADSGQSLDEILLRKGPMFGDPIGLCPLNVAQVGPGRGPAALRKLRDTVLLHSAVGTALVDTYYRISPAMARFLLRHSSILQMAQRGMATVEWTIAHYRAALGLLAVSLVLMVGWRRRRARAVAAALLVLLGLVLLSGPASATLIYLTTAELVANADNIVTGTVTDVDSHWAATGNRIVTDVTIVVNDPIKGRLNKSSSVYLQLPGGRISDIYTYTTDMPTFREGELIVLYLRTLDNGDQVVVGGTQGKIPVDVSKTGEKYVTANIDEAKAGPRDAASKVKDGSKKNNRIPLETYKQYLRDIVREQKRK